MLNIQTLTNALWSLTACCVALIVFMLALAITICGVQALVELIINTFR